MRKIILAATSVAVLAAPAVSMAAHSTVVPSRTMTPYTAQYTDSYGPAADQFNIVGTHIVKVAKNPANSFVEDKFTVKITDPATGKPAPSSPAAPVRRSPGLPVGLLTPPSILALPLSRWLLISTPRAPASRRSPRTPSASSSHVGQIARLGGPSSGGPAKRDLPRQLNSESLG